jgi:hypothetical protein
MIRNHGGRPIDAIVQLGREMVLEKRVRVVGIAMLILVLLAPRAAGTPPPLTLTYDLFSGGFPVLTLEFQVNETKDTYRVAGLVHSDGIVDFFWRYILRTESEGTVGTGELHPNVYMSDSRSLIRRRSAHLQFRADGKIMTALAPPDDSSQAAPTEQQITGSIDPLSGILQVGYMLARQNRCAGRIPIFDGRRRYDLVFIDEGVEHMPRSDDYAYVGAAWRCAINVIKIAGLTTDSHGENVDRGIVWLAALHPDAPPLPVRFDFTSSRGPMKLLLVAVRAGQ